MDSRIEPIGRRLVRAGLIDDAALAWALSQQRRYGGRLGQHLVDGGFLTTEQLHDALAQAWEERSRDLAVEPPQAGLLSELDVEETVELGWVACELTDDGRVIVASCVRPDEELYVEVQEHFPGMDAEFVACSRGDIDSVALDVRRRRLGQQAGVDGASLVTPADLALTTAGAVLAAVTAVVLPLPVLAVGLVVASAVFLAGAIGQWMGGFAELTAAAAQPLRPSPATGTAQDEGDEHLPLYTVIVRVAGGAAGLSEMFENFRALDYPRGRTDAILLVAEGDVDTLAALRSLERRNWARVAKVSNLDFLDVVRACDHGLALARGRYVVAFDQDERPAPDQLRRAVAIFEADLAAQLAARRPPDPLVGLRVARRDGPRGPSPLERLAAVDEVLGVAHRRAEWRGPDRSPDVTSVHFNMRLLRRAGGFGLLHERRRAGSVEGRAPRIETLESYSVRATGGTVRSWLLGRADAIALFLLDAGRGDQSRSERVALLSSGGAVAMFLAYPVVLGGGLVAAVRGDAAGGSVAVRMAWVGLGIAAIVLVAVIAVAASLLTQRREWRSSLQALTLPAHWLLHAVAAWAAAYAVLLRRGRRHQDPDGSRSGRQA